ncbi:hypothetical protein [Candidatus Methylocalor cossyra]|uniref:Sporulation related domain-containing protein n=1 Tax=Candidatus Methylocalor cossyra TaxID=3108543 RepID=A0ABM9NKU7_9GAMM
MKLLVYLLILLNVVFFLWESGFRHDPSDTAQALALPSDAEPIVLANEAIPSAEEPPEPSDAGPTAPDLPVPAEPPPPAAEPPPALPSPPAEPTCFRLGPLATREQATALLDLIKTHVEQAGIEARPGEVPDGWWVLFPKADNLDAARANRRELAKKGVRDMWVFEKGPLQGAISLGLYNTREQAEAGQRQFADKNVVTDVVPRLVRGRVYWVKIPWRRPALELEEIIQVLNTQDPELKIGSPIPCE